MRSTPTVVLLVFVAVAGVKALRSVESVEDFPAAYSLPMASEPVVSAATRGPSDVAVPMSLAEEQAAVEAAARAQARAMEAARTSADRPHPRGLMSVDGRRDGLHAYRAPADPLAGLFGTPLRPPQIHAKPGASASASAAAAASAPGTALLETRARAGASVSASAAAHAGAREDEDDEGGELQGSRQVEYGGNMEQAYNLYEQRVPVVPSPMSPSPFVEHPAPKQNLYPVEHRRDQLTVSPDTGELTPNAGDGLQATTMPWQYRPYIKQERLHRGVDPLVYKSMYAWKPHSAGDGDVSVQAAIKKPTDIFKPRDWSVKIKQEAANVEIARRGQDNYGADHGSTIAVPQMPPEFYMFSAPTPPMFHAPQPPAPRKAHADAQRSAPSIFPAFLETETTVTAKSQGLGQGEGESNSAYDINIAPGTAFKPYPLDGSLHRHDNEPGVLHALLRDPYWAQPVPWQRMTPAKLKAKGNGKGKTAPKPKAKPMAKKPAAKPQPKPKAKAKTAAKPKAKAQGKAKAKAFKPKRLFKPTIHRHRVVQPQVLSAGVTEADYLAALQSHVSGRMDAADRAAHQKLHAEYRAAAAEHAAAVRTGDARAAEQAKAWAQLSAEHESLQHARYDRLQNAADQLPHDRYAALNGAYAHARHIAPYERYDALQSAVRDHRNSASHTAPYDTYAALHTELYGVPPPPPPAAQPRFGQILSDADAQASGAVDAAVDTAADAEASDSDEGFSTGAPPASYFAPTDAETLSAAVDVSADAVPTDATAPATATTAAQHAHMPLLYRSVRDALRRRG